MERSEALVELLRPQTEVGGALLLRESTFRRIAAGNGVVR